MSSSRNRTDRRSNKRNGLWRVHRYIASGLMKNVTILNILYIICSLNRRDENIKTFENDKHAVVRRPFVS